ncbi:MAG: class I SAM-dependent methyltransferase [archaeon]|jgi:cyclopropane fatty-acyl-phospholipid synthase-like methyltransferase
MNLFQNKRNYLNDWLKNNKYTEKVYKEQKDASIIEPTVNELKNALKQYAPQSILEIGCGWGRLMKPINKEFNLEGCDIQKEYLQAAKKEGLKVYELDIVKSAPPKKYDLVYCYGLFMYFNEKQIQQALENTIKITNKKIIIFEWADTCEKILKAVNKGLILNSNKLELHIILNKGLEEWKKTKRSSM